MARVTDKKRKGCLGLSLSRFSLFVILPLTVILVITLIWSWLYARRVATERAVIMDLNILEQAISRYKADQGYYPKTLDDLLAPESYLEFLPPDPFDPNGWPYRYLNIDNESVVAVYSVGIDGMDNYTTMDIVHPSIVPSEPGGTSDLMAHLLIERTKDDPDNAMSLYQRGWTTGNPWIAERDERAYAVTYLISELGLEKTDLFLELVHSATEDLTRPAWWDEYWEGRLVTYRSDANSPSFEDLYSYVDSLRPSLDLFREAYRRPLIRSDGFVHSVPRWDFSQNFLNRQLYAQCMNYDAYRRENAGDRKGAIIDYLSMLRASQSIHYETGRMLDFLVSIAIARITLEGFIDSILRETYDLDELSTVLKELARLESGNPDLRSAMDEEHRVFCEFVDAMNRLPITDLYKTDTPLGRKYEDHSSSYPPVSFNKCCMELLLNAKGSKEANRRFWDYMIASLNTPYCPTDTQSLVASFDEMSDLNKLILSGRWNARISLISFQSKYRATQIVAGLKYYRAGHGLYPVSLDEIDDLYSSPLRDPYTEKAFIYAPRTTDFTLYSPGPDLVDQGARLEYDPTNGTFSSGDIIFAPRP